jgi:hypothetical protein
MGQPPPPCPIDVHRVERPGGRFSVYVGRPEGMSGIVEERFYGSHATPRRADDIGEIMRGIILRIWNGQGRVASWDEIENAFRDAVHIIAERSTGL